MDERELIERAVDGDALAERALYEQHVGRVYRLAYRMAGDETLAEDFTQETFVRAFERLAGFEGRSALATWLHSITTSVVLNGLRKIRRTRDREHTPEDLERAAGGRLDPDRALRLSLHGAIDQLNEGQRTVFVMHDIEGYTHREIAEVLAVEEGTSKARLSRARAELRKVLTAAGIRGGSSGGPQADRAPLRADDDPRAQEGGR